MKKFFTTVPLQIAGNLDRYVYKAVGNNRLAMAEPTSFPIISAINGYAVPGEEFRLITVASSNNLDVLQNQNALSEELEALCQRRGLTCKGVEAVSGPADQRVASHTATFQKLIDYVDDGDELFADITFGTKPMSMAILAAVRYAYRLKKNTSLSCVVYGEIDRSRGKDKSLWEGRIYDETALIQMDEITRLLSIRGVKDPKAIIDAMLEL